MCDDLVISVPRGSSGLARDIYLQKSDGSPFHLTGVTGAFLNAASSLETDLADLNLRSALVIASSGGGHLQFQPTSEETADLEAGDYFAQIELQYSGGQLAKFPKNEPFLILRIVPSVRA